jgi:hypothetical protein
MSNTIANTQLISTSNFDTNRMLFSDPFQGSIPGGGPSISFQRINISVRNKDGSVGELIMPTSRLFSFGVSENVDPGSGKVNGWTFPLCMWSKDGPTKEEKEWTDTFDAIVERCTEHVLDNKEKLDKYELEKSDLKKFNPMYWKKEKKMVNGKPVLAVVDGAGPTLYTKLIFSKKNDKFVTKFFDTNDNPIDPLTDLMGKYCYTNSAVKIESIFVGNKISLQVKLYEAVVEPMQTGGKRLLPRPQANSFVEATFRNDVATPIPPQRLQRTITGPVSTEDDDGSIDGGDEVEAPPVVDPPKKVLKRVIPVINKK